MNQRILVLAAMVASLLCSGCATTDLGAGAEPGKMSEATMQSMMGQAERVAADGNLIGAGEIYSKIIKSYPNNSIVWFRLGTTYLRNDQPDLAVIAYREALRYDPSMSKAWSNLAIAHLAQFRKAANKAVASDQTSESNRATLKELLVDVDHAVEPATAQFEAPKNDMR
ncbi:tetratricopeptide repeat protein [Collimonas humicola]|uniref:tetratricopeptide repeat protein n=1 Tax=Collimonas humicola TaxID=2825886 RepID=UPI001B8AB72E|nr:tetratricopeptide repeat protein [Collimonas humicola]